MSEHKDVIEVFIGSNEIRSSEDSSKFEDEIKAKVEEHLVADGIDPAFYRPADIVPHDGGYFIIMKFDRKKFDEVNKGDDEGVEFYIPEDQDGAELDLETSGEGDHPLPERNSNPRPSSAYDGAWSDRKFEIDVVQMCAILDVVNFAMEVSRPVEQGGMGAITETLPRSLGVVNNLCIKNTCLVDEEEVRRSVEAGRPVELQLDDGFKEHFKKWVDESVALFEEQYGSHRRKKVVQARMMPGQGFDPRGKGIIAP